MPRLHDLFIDMNSFFASVEQALRPGLRGRPVAVVPLLAETTCCIAASYEAKRHGVKTGTPVHEARRLCPGLAVVESRPHIYITMHRRIVEAVESCLPVGAVLSIDEMACPLVGVQQEPDNAVRLARAVKAAVCRDVHPHLTCSVGLAPNVLLAKVAADMHKPDGLTVIRPDELPERLFALQLADFPGVGPRMERRLHKAGVTTVEQFCRLTIADLARVWGSKLLGERWWRRLRGEQVVEPPRRRQSVSHSHVLPPQFRTDAGAHSVLVCLLHKAAARMRALGYWAGSLTATAAHRDGPSWQARKVIDPCQDTLTLLRVLEPLWQRKPPGAPLQVGVVLGHLLHNRDLPGLLFTADRGLVQLAATMDQVNERFGRHAVHFGGMLGAQGAAPTRISFTNIPDVGL